MLNAIVKEMRFVTNHSYDDETFCDDNDDDDDNSVGVGDGND